MARENEVVACDVSIYIKEELCFRVGENLIVACDVALQTVQVCLVVQNESSRVAKLEEWLDGAERENHRV